MDHFKPIQYEGGKKDFWLFTVLWLLYMIMTDVITGPDPWLVYVLEVLFLVLMYRGYVWVLYFQDARLLYGFVCAVIMVLRTVPELYWMRYAYPMSILISQYLGAVMVTAMCIILLVRRNLKYFIKIQQLKRKGKLDKLDTQILFEMKDTEI